MVWCMEYSSYRGALFPPQALTVLSQVGIQLRDNFTRGMNDLRRAETGFGHFAEERFSKNLRQLIWIVAHIRHGIADGVFGFLRQGHLRKA